MTTRARNALIIVDVQHDFLPPHGTLAVERGHEIIFPITRLVRSVDYDYVIASQDWHPINHMSFTSNGGIWPEHCVANTQGAQIDQMILDLHPWIVKKGFNPEVEAYSAFDGYVDSEGSLILLDFLGRNGVRTVDICGLALDYCVKATALSAVQAGLHANVLLDLTRPVDYYTGMQAVAEMVHSGVDVDVYDND